MQVFAMPETKFGLFPDNGASYLLLIFYPDSLVSLVMPSIFKSWFFYVTNGKYPRIWFSWYFDTEDTGLNLSIVSCRLSVFHIFHFSFYNFIAKPQYLSTLVGEYLGLTGARLDGAEMLVCGLATHFVFSSV